MIKFKIFLNFFIIFIILLNIKVNATATTITSDSSSSSSGSLITIKIIVDNESDIEYNNNLCGQPPLYPPCTSFGDAGDRARELLENQYYSKNGINNNQLIIELTNQVYTITDENSNCTFGNLFGYNSIIINNAIINSDSNSNSNSENIIGASSSSNAGGNSLESNIIIINGTDHSNSSLPFLIIEPIETYEIESIYFEINNIIFENFQKDIILFDFKINSSFYNPSTTSTSTSESQAQKSYLNIFQFYNIHFNNVNSTIVKSNPWSFENQENSQSDASLEGVNNRNENDLLSNIIFISSSFNNIITSEAQPTIQIFASKLQLLLCTIKNSMIIDNSMIYIEKGALKIYDSLVSNNLGNGLIQDNLLPIPMISMIDSGVNIQIESSIISNNQNLNCFFLCNQTLTPVTNFQPNYQYVLFDDLVVENNQFFTNLNPSDSEIGFISIVSNQFDVSFQKSFNNILFQNNSRGVINSIPLFYLENGNFQLDEAQFKDIEFYSFHLINTNVSLSDNTIVSKIPFIGANSQISYDTLSFIALCSDLAICNNCKFNGNYRPGDTCSTSSSSNDDNDPSNYHPNYTVIFVTIAAILVAIGIAGIIGYNFYVKKRVRSYFEKRSQMKKHSLDDYPATPDEKSYLVYDTNFADTDQVGGYDDNYDSLTIQVAGNVVNNY